MVLVAAAFFSGFQLGQQTHTAANQQASLLSAFFGSSTQTTAASSVDMSEFWKVWKLLQQKYVPTTSTSSPTTQEKVQGAIGGLVKSYGDPYTMFFPPKAAKDFNSEISGTLSGVGMEVGIHNNLITVIAPLPDSPAKNAGILSGDVITKINGTSTEHMSLDEAVNLIRGPKGSQVTLTLYRKGVDHLLTIPVTRDTIDIPTVKTEQKDGVFIISLYSFNALAVQKMQDAMRQYVKSGDHKLILDLRGNPGGYLEAAVNIASYFLPTGDVVVSENFGGGQPENVYRSKGTTLGSHAPTGMVVLVDGGSASAAEILSGALSEHHVATLMGEQTFGKGSVQELTDLPDGSSIKITVARWLTPDGISISEKGLTPQVYVPITQAEVKAGQDPQLDAALKWLHGDHNVGQKPPSATSTASTTKAALPPLAP